MKNVIAVLVAIASIGLAIYTGIWVMFIGGIVGLIEAFRADVLSSWDVSINVTKVMLAGLIGWLIFYVGCMIAALISGQTSKRFKFKR